MAATGLLQPVLVTVAEEWCDDWGAQRYLPVNLLMLLLTLVLASQPLGCWSDDRRPIPPLAVPPPAPARASEELGRSSGLSKLKVALLDREAREKSS